MFSQARGWDISGCYASLAELESETGFRYRGRVEATAEDEEEEEASQGGNAEPAVGMEVDGGNTEEREEVEEQDYVRFSYFILLVQG